MKFLFSVAALLSFLAAAAQPRFTDSTFGSNGKVVENTSVPYVDMIDAVLQPDGKTITLAESYYNAIARTVLIRYNANGTPDVSFSSYGIADSLITPGMDCNPEAVKLQADGKILVCGSAGDYLNKQAFVMRYNSNGSLDATFGTGGMVHLPPFTISSTSFDLYGIDNLTVLPGGRIMLLSTRSYPYADFALVRINPNGTVDNSFGTNGIAIINPPGVVSTYEQPSYTYIEAQADGKYIVGGSINSLSYILVRASATGTLDNSYGTNGAIRLSGGPTGDGLADMLIQPDGKIVVSGAENFYGLRTYTCIMRITKAGTLDGSFGSGGRQLLYTMGNGFTATASQLGLQADGKLLIGGMAKTSNGNYTIAATRLTTGGSFDAGFGSNGVALLQVNGYNSFGYVPLPQSDGKITIAGFARSGSAVSATIGRFTGTGQTDATLNAAASITLLNNGTADEDGYNIHVQPADQKIVTVRERSNGYDYDLCVSRHLPNGQPDAGYGTNGKAYIDMPG